MKNGYHRGSGGFAEIALEMYWEHPEGCEARPMRKGNFLPR